MDKEQRRTAKLIREFLAKTACWRCGSYCSLAYYPIENLCHGLETDIEQFLNGTSNMISSQPPSIQLVER